MSEDPSILELHMGPLPGREAWREAVEKSLAGASFEKKLVSQLEEGLEIQPLYTRADLPSDPDPAGFPGTPPLIRGAAPLPPRAGWVILQVIDHPDPAGAAALAATELERGATGIRLDLDAAFRAGRPPSDPDALPLLGEGGIRLATAQELAEILGALPAGARLTLRPGARALPAAALLVAACEQRGVDPISLRADLGVDPIGALARDGSLPLSLEGALEELGAVAAWMKARFPRSTVALASTEAFHHAGANAIQELAIALSIGALYLRSLEAAGLSIEEAADRIVLQLQVGSDVFLEIAKLRVARRLWSRILEASGVESPTAHLHAQTAWRSMTTRDPWVNMLRGTVAAFAASAGGAQAFTVRPFDAALGHSDDFARRIARNTQLVLRDESQLHRVLDPAGGSFYVERLSEELAVATWSELQALEAEGGVAAALRSGALQAKLQETTRQRREAVARRKLPITGVSEFPHLEERPLDRRGPDLDGLRSRWVEAANARATAAAASEAASVDEAIERAAAGAASWELGALARLGEPIRITPFHFERLSEPFERLRDRADAYLARNGKRPQVFLANLGPVARHLARATFAANFFAAGGIEALGNEGFESGEEAAAAFRESGSPIAVICGADADYEDLLPEVAAALKGAGARVVMVAGRPGGKEEAWRAAGADAFIFLGSDLLASLEGILDGMGA